MRKHLESFIAGEWKPTAPGDFFDVVSPSTEERVAKVGRTSKADVDVAITAATSAARSGEWRHLSLDERSAVLEKAAAALVAESPGIAETTTVETGMPLATSRRQVEAAAGMLHAAVSNARTVPKRVVRSDTMGNVVVELEPVGPVGAIVPWNGPLSLSVLKVAPALLAGCPVVLKGSPLAPLSPYAIARALADAGLPKGMLSVVAGDGDIGEQIVADPRLPMITFTGSTAVGRSIGAQAGQLLKKVALELGGKSAAIILDDADVPAAVDVVAGTVLSNMGQYCRALSRVLVPRSMEAEVVQALAARAEAIVIGDPMDPATVMGPLISKAQRDRVESYVDLATSQGARVVAGGRRPQGLDRGWYFEPTVLSGVSNSHRVAQEEIFGPVVCVIPYDGEDEAVALANDISYGLSGAVFTADAARGYAVAQRIETGVIGVNSQGARFCAPCGGTKLSGVGQEHGPEGYLEFLEPKTILIPGDVADDLVASGVPFQGFRS
ncbi:aldehyde dehydrogenase family protein [Rhodococcus sp. WAY2]|uniref:aldehyde dehydrogenase family protein n=1 Tax=Rhodococcus sp. WAY2 TaxID=2663121 RepID=UPI00131FC41F|nr:aldehyde dehydrogenase family protein [Rhodococcus sp. WAY2]QHE73300.1 Aldehyde dehydrogenase [Rhodococcus sp. WAY2]